MNLNPLSTRLESDFAKVAALVSYMTVAINPTGDEWITSASLLSDESLLPELLATTGTGRGTDDRVVSASLFIQSYAYRLAVASLAPMALTGRCPNVAIDHVAFRIARNRPAGIALLSASELETSSDESLEVFKTVFDSIFNRHLDPLIEHLREITRIGERLLWGNVASSFVNVLRTLESAHPESDSRAHVRRFTTDFLDAAPHALAELGTCFSLHSGDAEGWFHQRNTCCLWHKTQESQRAAVSVCADCSLTPNDERRASLLAELRTASSTGTSNPSPSAPPPAPAPAPSIGTSSS